LGFIKKTEIEMKKNIFIAFLFLLLFISCTNKRTVYIGEYKDYEEVVLIGTSIKHGIFIRYDFNGDTVEKCNYSMNKLDGEYIEFYEGGKQRHAIANYNNGKFDGEYKEFYKKGNLKFCIDYKKNKIWNIKSYFDINSKILLNNEFLNGNGIVYKYDDVGNVIEVGEIKNGLKEGKWVTYTNTGHADTILYDNGRRKKGTLPTYIF
jgi:antitoxin component YwqK of YwqJK toxin-antitoxin module